MAKRLEVAWTGLGEFEKALEDLPKHLIEEANGILLKSAQDAKAAIAAAYPLGPGNKRKGIAPGGLKRGLVLRPARGRTFAGAVLRQRAPHGSIYENGTEVRENKAGQNRGFSKPHPTFWPIANAHLDAAIRAVVDRLYAHGAAEVTGDIAA